MRRAMSRENSNAHVFLGLVCEEVEKSGERKRRDVMSCKQGELSHARAQTGLPISLQSKQSSFRPRERNAGSQPRPGDQLEIA
jgi:hypothetical protein